jgi:hypothetical protein
MLASIATDHFHHYGVALEGGKNREHAGQRAAAGVRNHPAALHRGRSVRIDPILLLIKYVIDNRTRTKSSALNAERIAQLREQAAAGANKTKLAKEFGISRETLYQYIR